MDKNNEAHCEYDMNVEHSQDRVPDLLDTVQQIDDHTMLARRKYWWAVSDLPCKVMLKDCARNAYKRPEISRMRMSKSK